MTKEYTKNEVVEMIQKYYGNRKVKLRKSEIEKNCILNNDGNYEVNLYIDQFENRFNGLDLNDIQIPSFNTSFFSWGIRHVVKGNIVEKKLDLTYNDSNIQYTYEDLLVKLNKAKERMADCVKANDKANDKYMLRLQIEIDSLTLLMVQRESLKLKEQPELPSLKNMEMRKEWLENYHNWGLWYEDLNMEAKYYKYDFSDGSKIIVVESLKWSFSWRENKSTYKYDADYHLVKDKAHINLAYADFMTTLIEFLKNLQKS